MTIKGKTSKTVNAFLDKVLLYGFSEVDHGNREQKVKIYYRIKWPIIDSIEIEMIAGETVRTSQKCQAIHFSRKHFPNLLTDEDLIIHGLLSKGGYRNNLFKIVTEAEYGYALILKLLTTGRAFGYTATGEYVTLNFCDTSVDISLNWQSHNGEYLLPALTLTPPLVTLKILTTEPLLVVGADGSFHPAIYREEDRSLIAALTTHNYSYPTIPAHLNDFKNLVAGKIRSLAIDDLDIPVLELTVSYPDKVYSLDYTCFHISDPSRDSHNEQAAVHAILELGWVDLKSLIETQVNGNIFVPVDFKDLLVDYPQINLQKLENCFVRFLEQSLKSLEERIDVVVERYKLQKVTSLSASVEQEGDNDFSLALNLGDEDLLKPLLKLFANFDDIDSLFKDSRQEIFLPTGDSISRLDFKTLEPYLWSLYDLFSLKNRKDKISLSREQLLSLAIHHHVSWEGDYRALEIKRKASDYFSGKSEYPLPQHLNANLRSYQIEGFKWLQFLREMRFSGMLADDMGLGKTIQTLAHLQKEKEEERLSHPVLIIAPRSTLGNWKVEIDKFTPGLKSALYLGKERQLLIAELTDYDLVITSFQTFLKDSEIFQAFSYSYVVIDEAQTIKNPRTKLASAVFNLNSQYRLALTGTPIENRVTELWSLFHFISPGLLGSFKSFKKNFETIQAEEQRNIFLYKRIKPFILRRTKQEVLKELPPKSEIEELIELDSHERQVYDMVRLTMQSELKSVFAQKGVKRAGIEIIDAMLKLRQVCCDLRLVKVWKDNEKVKLAKNAQSSKLLHLTEMVQNLLNENRSVLIFSQFTSMIKLIEEKFKGLQIPFLTLTGQTRDREKVINEFQNGDFPVFLLSLKAGGFGLNLTKADTVIHYDPWWNPAVEAQATDRAHRIGQDKKVFVYRLICVNTIEEKIRSLQRQKQSLADTILSGTLKGMNLDMEDINYLLS